MTTSRVFNFSAGPAALPTEVLERAQAEMLDWHGKGMSIMEMSHRGEAFMSVAKEATDDLRELMSIPENYHILFLQGGATCQFSMVPMNLMTDNGKADYTQTGVWSKKAIAEGKRYGDIHIAMETRESDGQVTMPERHEWSVREDIDYFHYTPNETINGICFHDIPEVDAPLVADMSSNILSEPLDVSKFGVIYAGAQKNLGPAGVTIVIVRDDLLKNPHPHTPTLLSYQTQAQSESMYNTPPTYSWYMVGLVLKWIKQHGGLVAMQKRNREKAQLLYEYIDSSDFYHNPVAANIRSIMNVPFTLRDDSLDKAFLLESEKAGLSQLKGHRVVGGMRASIYNAMPKSGIEALINFMHEFASKNA